MQTAQCRSCQAGDLRKALVTPPLPEYIWPVSSVGMTRLSPCEVYQCSKCHHLQLQAFTDEELKTFYAHGSFVQENMRAKEERLRKILDSLGGNFFKDKKVLDVGGGNNPFVKLLCSFTQKLFVSDFEISPETHQICEGRVFSGKFEETQIPDKDFDTILSFHSMEHMNEPARVAEKMKTILKKDGKLIVEVPNIVEVVRAIPYYSIFHQHISMFTRNSLIDLFQSHGFSLETVLSDAIALLMVFKRTDEHKAQPHADLGAEAMELYSKRMAYLDSALTQFIQKAKPQNLAIYGAGGSSALLVQHFASIKNNLKLCFDRESTKQGKFLPGTKVQILPPEEIWKSDCVIFLSNQMRDLFKASLTCPMFSAEEALNHFGGKTYE